jgi:hypothetical protein
MFDGDSGSRDPAQVTLNSSQDQATILPRNLISLDSPVNRSRDRGVRLDEGICPTNGGLEARNLQ